VSIGIEGLEQKRRGFVGYALDFSKASSTMPDRVSAQQRRSGLCEPLGVKESILWGRYVESIF